MRVFRNVEEMVKEVERELFEMGIINHPMTCQDQDVATNAGFNTKELLAYSYSLTEWPDIEEIFSMFDNPSIKENGREYCKQEIMDRLHNKHLNPGHAWTWREDIWKQFLEKNGRFAYTYNERMRAQLTRVIEELKEKPGSRQCIVTIYDHHQDLHSLGGISRVPCSMHYQFLLREINNKKHLTCIYVMRSCDYYNHFPIDVYLGIKLLEHVALKVDAVPSNFVHFMGSLHAYAKDFGNRRIF